MADIVVHAGMGSDLVALCGKMEGISGHDQVRLSYVAAQVTCVDCLRKRIEELKAEVARLREDNALSQESLRLYRRLCNDNGCPSDESQYYWLTTEFARLRAVVEAAKDLVGTGPGKPGCMGQNVRDALAKLDRRP